MIIMAANTYVVFTMPQALLFKNQGYLGHPGGSVG